VKKRIAIVSVILASQSRHSPRRRPAALSITRWLRSVSPQPFSSGVKSLRIGRLSGTIGSNIEIQSNLLAARRRYSRS